MIHKLNGFFGSGNHARRPSFSLSSVSIEKIYQTMKTGFDNVSKHLMAKVQKFKVRLKNDPMRIIFSTLFSVFGIVVIQTRSFVFDILLGY